MVTALKIAIAAVWFTFGFLSKILDLVPRHRLIVASVLGETLASHATFMVGAGETIIGIWVLSGYWPRLCAAAQTLAIVAMNSLELAFAADLLLAPALMIGVNIVFLGAAWYCALKSEWPAKRR